MFNRSTANYVYEEKIKRSPKLTMLRYALLLMLSQQKVTSHRVFNVVNSKSTIVNYFC